MSGRRGVRVDFIAARNPGQGWHKCKVLRYANVRMIARCAVGKAAPPSKRNRDGSILERKVVLHGTAAVDGGKMNNPRRPVPNLLLTGWALLPMTSRRWSRAETPAR